MVWRRVVDQPLAVRATSLAPAGSVGSGCPWQSDLPLSHHLVSHKAPQQQAERLFRFLPNCCQRRALGLWLSVRRFVADQEPAMDQGPLEVFPSHP